MEYRELDLNSIKVVPFPESQYIRKQYEKTQLVAHHTVSDPVDSMADFRWWEFTESRIATFAIVNKSGKIYQCFNSSYCGGHLGVSGRWDLDKHSIGVELDNWGGLTYNPLRGFVNAYDQVVDVDESRIVIFEGGFRGYEYFEMYSEVQLEQTYSLFKYLGEQYSIPLVYNEDMWDVSDRALAGESGVWTHVSYREDKSDCFPQSELIQVFKALS